MYPARIRMDPIDHVTHMSATNMGATNMVVTHIDVTYIIIVNTKCSALAVKIKNASQFDPRRFDKQVHCSINLR